MITRLFFKEKGMHKIVALIVAMMLCCGIGMAQELNWITVPETALAVAQQTGQPVFVDVFTTWCSWCKKLDQETFSTAEFKAEAARFVLLKVDGDRYRAFIQKYNVQGYPTMLFLDKDGAEIHNRIVGFVNATELVAAMQEVPNRGLTWLTNPEQAFAQAHQAEKRIFTYASMAGCSWCEKLEKETFTNPKFIETAAKFILLKVDRKEHAAFVQKHGVTGYPTMLFLSGCDKEIYQRVIGFSPASRLVSAMEEALKVPHED